MKDNNNSKNKQNKNIYVYNNNDSEDNIKMKNNKKDDSYHKYYKTLEDTHESYEILKQLEILNLSDKKSFEIPKKVTINLNKNNDTTLGKTKINKGSKKEKRDNNINIEDQIYKNKKEDKSENIKLNIDDEPSIREENQQLSEFLLREKLNRICASIQGYTLNQKCYENLNNFIPYISEIPQNLYQPLDLLFDVFDELLCRIKQEFNVKENLIHKLNDISLNNEEYEKKLLKLKKEIKEKDKEIGSLISNLNIEKEKANNDSKSKILEINSLKKENQQLSNNLILYKSQIKKSEEDYKLAQNKLKYYIFEKENKNNLASSFDKISLNNKEEKNQDEFKIKNEKYLDIKKLNMNLVYLLKDINKNICKYDFSLNKIINDNNRRNNYEIDDLSNNIESNLLIDESKCKNFCKNFLFNMDLINNKIIDILKLKNNWVKTNNNNNNLFKPQDIDNKGDKFVDSFYNQKEEAYNNKKNNKDKYSSINANSSNKINSQKNNNNMNIKSTKNNNLNNSDFDFNKIGRNANKTVNQKYDYHSKNYNKTINNRSERKKNTINFLNFYNNEDKEIETNNEKKAIDPKWYENFKNKKVGYVFDKNKLFTCNDEDDRTNGANRK